MGVSTSVYANRIGGFAGSVKNYQDALMQYRKAMQTNSAAKAMAKQKAITAFQKMQIGFRHELNVVNASVKSKKGTPLTSAIRGTNIARSSRNIVKLNITSHVQASNLVKLTKYAKVLGSGLAVIDFSSRVGSIHNSYQADGEWERKLFIESSSFSLGVIAGSLAVKGGLALLVFATPVGWVGLIIGGAVVAGVSAGAAITVDNVIKNNSSSVYDEIMAWLK